MPTVQHAFDVLDSAAGQRLPRMVALFGDDRFLKRLVLDHVLAGGSEAGEDARYAGDAAEWREIADDLATGSLFSSGPRRVLVSDADALVTRCRGELESYAGGGAGGGTLVLELASLPSNTRLYRSVAEHGWLIDCRPPEIERGRSKVPDVNRTQKWLDNWAKRRHNIRLLPEAMELLTGLVGWDFGRLDQELAKLALFVEQQGRIDAELVQQVVGGWRTQTTWEMLDAVAEGRADAALRQLDQLLQAGESPLALFGSTAWSLRRFAAATRLVERQERHGGRLDLAAILQQAGFRNWPSNALDQARKQLQQISRQRGGQLYRWLLETDLALKGSHSSPHRSRWALELLFLRLAKAAR
jgi:DNA polymerase-3 subunit delta